MNRIRIALGVTLAAALGVSISTFAAASNDPPITATAPASTYESLSSLEFPALKTALEKAGWPAVHVQAFLNAEIQHRIDPPKKLTSADFRAFQFWRTGPDAEPLAPLNTPELDAERTRREEAIRDQFDALFPPSAQDADQLLLVWEARRKWGDLPEEKRQAVSTLLARAEKERDAIMHHGGGLLTTTEHRQLWKLAEGTRAEIARLLTAAELLDYDLRNSSTANRMRSELDNFQPTQDEFIALLKLRLPLELQFAHKSPGLDPDIDRARTEAEASVDKAIAHLLGPARHDDYRLSLQPACQTLQFDGRFARTDAATVRRLYRFLLSGKERIEKLSSAPEAEKQPALERIKAELYREFRAVLDEEGTRRYLQEQGLWP